MTILICVSTMAKFVKPRFFYRECARRTHVVRLWRLQITWEVRKQ